MAKILKLITLLSSINLPLLSIAQYPPAANEVGTTAIHKDSSVFVNWADSVYQFNRGSQDISAGTTPFADFGDSTAALGKPDAIDVVSLGDGGSITLKFPIPIANGSGPDFAVFENSFSHTFLELAHVEVSTDGNRFVRFPSSSLTQTDTQIGGFGALDPTKIHNLAGKYKGNYGTPFDLDDLIDSTGIDLSDINYVKVIDVVGSIDPQYGSRDADGNLINDPFPTPAGSSGFDMDGVGVINQKGEAASLQNGSFSFSVYPNPTQSNLHIRASGRHGLKIFNTSCQLLFETDFVDQTALNLPSVIHQKGLFILQIDEKNEKIIFQ